MCHHRTNILLLALVAIASSKVIKFYIEPVQRVVPTYVAQLVVGKIERIPQGSRQTASISLVYDNGYYIMVDSPSATDVNAKTQMLKGLTGRNLAPGNVQLVVTSHGHPDHFGQGNFFPNARHFFGSYEYSDDAYIRTELATNDTMRITPNVELWNTPGHTSQDISVVVRNVPCCGTVAVVGDLFYNELDATNGTNWYAEAWNAEIGKTNRNKMLCAADYIIPGHGKLFRITPEMRSDAGCGTNGNAITATAGPIVSNSINTETTSVIPQFQFTFTNNTQRAYDDANSVTSPSIPSAAKNISSAYNAVNANYRTPTPSSSVTVATQTSSEAPITGSITQTVSNVLNPSAAYNAPNANYRTLEPVSQTTVAPQLIKTDIAPSTNPSVAPAETTYHAPQPSVPAHYLNAVATNFAQANRLQDVATVENMDALSSSFNSDAVDNLMDVGNSALSAVMQVVNSVTGNPISSASQEAAGNALENFKSAVMRDSGESGTDSNHSHILPVVEAAAQQLAMALNVPVNVDSGLQYPYTEYWRKTFKKLANDRAFQLLLQQQKSRRAARKAILQYIRNPIYATKAQ